jgi:hypothetical protein
MDLITTGVSASERMRRESVLSAIRSIIMEKMQLGGPSMRLLEVCKFIMCKSFVFYVLYHNQCLNVPDLSCSCWKS